MRRIMSGKRTSLRESHSRNDRDKTKEMTDACYRAYEGC